MKKSLSVVILLFLEFALGVEISPTAELRRASLLLKGTLPSQSDYQKVLSAKDKRQAISDIEQIYLKSPEYALRMRMRMQDLFSTRHEYNSYHGQLPGPENKLEGNFSPNTTQGNTNALDQLFFAIIAKNLSWDNLLLSKKYSFKIRNEYPVFLRDKEFLEKAFPEELNPIDEYSREFVNIEGKSENQKLILAGALTTSRFFSRFQTTKLNQNRRRAAAIFRIFLCDNLKPVILPSSAEDKELLNLSLDGYTKVDGAKVSMSTEDRHAKDPQCQSCHYKLDPAAKTFRGSSLYLNERPAAGALVFRQRDGTLVNIPVRGIGELADAITKQPEYAQCQVKHFWNWFIGKDVLLEPKRQQELVAAFEKSGRRPHDFMKELLASKEFRTLPAENRVTTFSHVEPLFKACNSCHLNEPKTPQIANYPFAKDKRKNFEAIESVARETDLKRNGLSRKMPPNDAGWALGEDDFSILKEWISQGAKDASGETYLTQEEIDQFLPKEQQNIKPVYKATFDDTYFRYLAGFDFSTALVGLLNNSPTMPAHAREFGFKDPATGVPYIMSPNAATINAELQIIQNELSSKPDEFWDNLLGIKSNELWTAWNEIEKNRQIEILGKIIDFTIGPKVMDAKLRDKFLYSLEKGVEAYLEKSTEKRMRELIVRAFLLVFTTERFQTI